MGKLQLKTSEIERLTKFHVRFSCLFTDVKVFTTFIGFSVISLISGLLALLYYALSNDFLITIAVWIEIATIIGTIVAMLCIFIATNHYSKKDLQTVIDYAQSRPPKPKRKPQGNAKKVNEASA